jgi:hypothetical protein
VTLFLLGCPEPAWLTLSPVPLFVSHRRLQRRVALPRAACSWSLDSGAFTELAQFGTWRTSPDQYAADVLTYSLAIGSLLWAAPQDWPCEPMVLAKTGLTVAEHQRRTTDNYLALRCRLGSLVIPVVQGSTPADYMRHVGQYAASGVDLAREPLVGVGSVCRRRRWRSLRSVLDPLAGAGLKLHGFGVKSLNLQVNADLLVSADSMAWSYHARRRPALPQCRHTNCNSCLLYALWWRSSVAGVR